MHFPDLATLLVISVAALALIAVPGPNVIYIVASALGRGAAATRGGAPVARTKRPRTGRCEILRPHATMVGARHGPEDKLQGGI